MYKRRHQFLLGILLLVANYSASFCPSNTFNLAKSHASIILPGSPKQQRYSSWKPLFAFDSTEDSKTVESKEERLLSLLSYIENLHASKNLAPCGLEAADNERALVHSVLTEVEEDAENNLVTINNGKIDAKDLFGDWNLLYTSSQTIVINKSLSGLGRSTSDKAKFSGILQKLAGNKYLGNVELVEHFQGASEDASFDVKVTGEWFTLPDTNPFTRNPNTAIEILPEKIDYVATATSAEDWASLGPIKRLDIIYLSKTMMISRGSANVDSLFVWKRV